MTNTIRPVVVASLLVSGEAQDAMDSERTQWSAGGIKQIDPLGNEGWLVTEWKEVSTQ
jgi:hypothetical protein